MFHHVSFVQMSTGEDTHIACSISENRVALSLKFRPNLSFCTGIRVAINYSVNPRTFTIMFP